MRRLRDLVVDRMIIFKRFLIEVECEGMNWVQNLMVSSCENGDKHVDSIQARNSLTSLVTTELPMT
jgi:hypothetical protein